MHYVVKYDKKIVGFFTASMGALEVKKMKDSEKITEVPQLHSYPVYI
jgi:hypothetical protein